MNKILIIDDEGLIRNVLSQALSNEHTEVKTAATGRDALHCVHSTSYNLCFLDMQLPDMNGLEVMKKIKTISPETKVVIMSANLVTEEMKREIQKMAYGFVSKPFGLSQIKTISEQLVSVDRNIKESRRNKRITSMETISYYVSVFENSELKILHLTGNIVDKSDRGIGIKTDYFLTPSYMIRFADETNFKAGVVRWSMTLGNNMHYAGIEFIDDRETLWFR